MRTDYRRIMDDREQELQMINEALSDENLALLQDEIEETYGFPCPAFTVKEGRRSVWVESEPLDISNETILSTFIKEIRITSSYGTWAWPDENMVGLSLDVKYEHTGRGGSNGYEIGTAYYDIDNGFWTVETSDEYQQKFARML